MGNRCTLQNWNEAPSPILPEKIIFQDAPESAESIAPVDFFPLGICSSVVGNGDFVDAGLELRRFGRDLRFEPKPVFLNRDALNDFPPENFVASFHIRQIEIRRHIGQKGKQLVAKRMPIVEHAMRSAAREP